VGEQQQGLPKSNPSGQAAGENSLDRAYALLRAGQLIEAEALCRHFLERWPRDASATHLLGLIRKDAGDSAAGERLLAESIELDPLSADFRANLAHLLRRLGRAHEAEHLYRDALALEPRHRPARFGLARTLCDLRRFAAAEAECRTLITANSSDAQAWTGLAMALRDQNRLAEAEAAYLQAITVDPYHAAAHHNLGSLLSRMERAEEALAALARAQSLGIKGFELAFNRGRALTQLYRMDEAEQSLAEAVSLEPTHIDAQLNLARLRHMRQDPDFARDIVAAAAASRDNTALQLLHANVLWRAGALSGAESVCRDLLARRGPDPDVRVQLARVLQESGRLQEAELEALEAATAKPEDATIVETLVAILLSRGRPEDALPFIATQRSRDPDDQGWIAYEATTARLLDPPRYRELCNYSHLVRTFELEPPAGWNSMAELNAAVLEALNARHRFATHPLDQSVRNGSQTARSLLTDPDPAIRALMQAFAVPIHSYRQLTGTSSAHPLSARNRGAVQFSGAWSVQLRREGYHVNHFHPQGWISSAYYVSVPDEVNDLDLMSGWIKFGEPRFAVPGVAPEVFVKPHPGRLVLFPSYLWHGTNPIHGSEPRTAIAFDVVPGRDTSA
jgi:Flp pilus assembly protein TadD